MTKTIQILLALILMCASCSVAQTEPDTGGLAVGVYGSGGTMGGGGGAYLGFYDAGPFRRIWNNGFFLDLGVTGPTRKATADGLFSFNSQSTYLLHRGPDRARKPGLLFWTVGYSRLFNNGNGSELWGRVDMAISTRTQAHGLYRDSP